jgi:hypothetical protein
VFSQVAGVVMGKRWRNTKKIKILKSFGVYFIFYFFFRDFILKVPRLKKKPSQKKFTPAFESYFAVFPRRLNSFALRASGFAESAIYCIFIHMCE